MASWFTAIVNGIADWIGWQRKRQDLINTPQMQANASAAQDQKVMDDARSDVASKNADQIRKDLS